MKNKKGLAFLPTVLMIGIIMTEVGVALALMLYLSNLSSYGTRLSHEALFASRTGINDAVLRMNRDNTFPIGFNNYEISIGRAIVSVDIEKDVPRENQNSIISSAVVLNRQKKLKAIVSLDLSTGKVSVVSLDEI